MYKSSYQRRLFTLLSSVGSKPLDSWNIREKDGYITRFLDPELKALVLEIGGSNVSTTYITCPKDDKNNLAIRLPFLVMIVKNLHKYFTFEVTILDENGLRRRFRVANFQSCTNVSSTCTSMPIRLEDGWNQIHFNLADFTRRAYNKQYIQTQKVKVNANIRLRRIYFAEKIYRDSELPDEYKLYFPIPSKNKQKVDAEKDKENISPSTSRIIAALNEEPKAEPPPMTFFDFRRRSSPDFRRKSSAVFKRESSSRIALADVKKELLPNLDHPRKTSSGLTVVKDVVSKETLSSPEMKSTKPVPSVPSGHSRASRIGKHTDLPGGIATSGSPGEATEEKGPYELHIQSGVLEGVEVINVMPTSPDEATGARGPDEIQSVISGVLEGVEVINVIPD